MPDQSPQASAMYLKKKSVYVTFMSHLDTSFILFHVPLYY